MEREHMSDNQRESTVSSSAVLRCSTVIGAGLALIWICEAGLLAAFSDPYLIPFLALLGTWGVASCMGALVSVLGDPRRTGSTGVTIQAVAWLAGAFGIASILWVIGRPTVAGPGPEVILVGVVLATAAVLGILGLILLSFFSLMLPTEDGDRA